jgi:hypothetical protein
MALEQRKPFMFDAKAISGLFAIPMPQKNSFGMPALAAIVTDCDCR